MNPKIFTILFNEDKNTQNKNKKTIHKGVGNWNELYDVIENYCYDEIIPDSTLDISHMIHTL